MAIKEPPAIFFHPDAVETKGKDLVGRRSAGESFLKGFLRHTPGDHVNAVTETPAAAKAFEDRARELGETRPIKVDTLRGQPISRAQAVSFFPGRDTFRRHGGGNGSGHRNVRWSGSRTPYRPAA